MLVYRQVSCMSIVLLALFVMEYERCFVFEPEDGPASKRRRVEAQGLHTSWPARHRLYTQNWNSLNRAFDAAIEATNAKTAAEIDDFIHSPHEDCPQDRLPTGIILLEPGSSSRYRFKDTIINQSDGRRTQIIALESGSATNLKLALKSLNDAAIRVAEAPLPFEAIDEPEEDEEAEAQEASVGRSYRKPNGRRLLAYDLQILEEYVRQEGITSAVIHLEDTEGFSTEVLASFIQQLCYWRNRIPVSLLLNVSTSIDILERRLSRGARTLLQTKLFKPATCQQEFEALINALMTIEGSVVLGPTLMRLTGQRQMDHLQDITCIRSTWKYALMTAYFANPLTVFLSEDTSMSTTHDHFEALRSLPSFRQDVRRMLDDDARDVATVRRLLENDLDLEIYVRQRIRDCRTALHSLFDALRCLQIVQKYTPSVKESSIAALYMQGLSGVLRGSASLRGKFLALRKASLADIANVMREMQVVFLNADWPSGLISEIDASQQREAGSDVVSGLVTRVCKALEQQLEKYLIDVKDMPFHECLLWDSGSPFREVFMPKPRQAVERALISPHDYLDCDCCERGGLETGNAAHAHSRTSGLYSLYKESGNLINVHDAWQAFEALTAQPQEEQKQTMALFQRSMAELKHLGMVKTTRKRVDHIAKVAWPGL